MGIDYTTFTEVDNQSALSTTSTTATGLNVTHDDGDVYLYEDKGAGSIGDFTATFAAKFVADGYTQWGECTLVAFGVTNTVGDWQDWWADTLFGVTIFGHESPASIQVYIQAYNDGTGDYQADGGTSISSDTWYYFYIEKSGDTWTCEIYDDPAMGAGDLVDTLGVQQDADYTYRYYYPWSNVNDGEADGQADLYVKDHTDVVAANTPPDQPTVTVSAYTDGDVKLTGDAFSDSDGGDTLQQAQWEVRTTGDVQVCIDTTGAGVITKTFTDELDPSTEYKARVRYSDGTDWSTWSSDVNFTTWATPTVSVAGSGSASATFTSSASQTGHNISDWECRKQSDSSLVASSYDDSVNLVNWAATGLEAGTGYKIRVRHASDAGDSEWSAYSLFTTAAAGIYPKALWIPESDDGDTYYLIVDGKRTAS